MLSEAIQVLSSWSALDTWIVLTAGLAAMACSVPGVFLVVRRQSMMGDALSHTTLPGIVIAFLLAHWLRSSGWISSEVYHASRHAVVFVGALVVGILSAALTEAVQKLGKVEASAALGVVFTTLFALGLLLIRVAADNVHIDPDCVLYGIVETVVLDTVSGTQVPRAAVSNAVVLGLNLVLVVTFFKELRISAFDPALATTLGINGQAMHYAIMAVTAATLVTAFESVGSILVIAMLIVPPATAHLLTDRLPTMIGLSLLLAAAAALLGHVMAITLPSIIFSRLGMPTVADASVAGMIATASGMLFGLAMLFGPRYGLLSRFVQQTRLGLRIASEDILGGLYRAEEESTAESEIAVALSNWAAADWILNRLAIRRLQRAGEIIPAASGFALSERGRRHAEQLVRAHRLWESYMAKHFDLPDDHLHDTASRVEHYLDPAMRARLADELDGPGTDPHGREIPGQ